MSYKKYTYHCLYCGSVFERQLRTDGNIIDKGQTVKCDCGNNIKTLSFI